ncbi:hypothetical protein PENANT_c019G00547 [Penicillium antarcticum]|uniref:endo-1,3(4)-beta-glucanase n=1 Tax=Penicillium antarcticum TaxID=416450 RepID=A0A1V6Q0Q4_9EURO|nr:uncharacterized protein N7508_001015 [Penicillium antarcticum]KAJ5316507.1 hypothetical protein N7508_001015 [Penicillium antarcticum]OQD82858.1 hypothetical protein PENANT_c019G00547 [Penicillium antarcticum]
MVTSRSLSAGSLMLALLSSPVAATSYSLVETWQGKNFLDYFNFHTGSDPTNGYVNYLDKASAESAGLVKVTDSGSVYLGVDHTTTLDPNGKGRDSVRIGSKKYYDQSLVIADIAHMPGSVCGTWPAFWSVGKNWPGDGEIDIIEGVNLQDHNEIVMHTAGTCSLTDTDMTGVVNATGCGEDLGTVGCVIEGHKGSYGTSFNGQGGGVYAMQWTDEFLKIWYFPRSSIPASITSGKPDVTKFGTPMALVKESCDVANAFKAQSFIFDVTFCGDWAGGVFGDSGCPMSDSDSFQSCHNFVANHPAQYEQSYWEINSVKIYQTSVEETAVVSSQSSESAAPVNSAASETEAAAPTTEAAPVVSKSTGENHATAVHSSASQGTAAVGSIQELNPTSTAPAAALGKTATEEIQQSHATKKTRTITALVTSTKTICPEAEKSSSLAALLPATPVVTTPAVPVAEIPGNSQQVKEATSAAAIVAQSSPTSQAVVPVGQIQPFIETGVSAQSSPVAAAHDNVPSSAPVNLVSGAAPSAPAPTETPSMAPFGASWLHPSATRSAAPSNVASQPSRALGSAPTDVSPETAATSSGSFVSSESTTGAVPVFTGAAQKLSLSAPAVLCALIAFAL